MRGLLTRVLRKINIWQNSKNYFWKTLLEGTANPLFRACRELQGWGEEWEQERRKKKKQPPKQKKPRDQKFRMVVITPVGTRALWKEGGDWHRGLAGGVGSVCSHKRRELFFIFSGSKQGVSCIIWLLLQRERILARNYEELFDD